MKAWHFCGEKEGRNRIKKDYGEKSKGLVVKT